MIFNNEPSASRYNVRHAFSVLEEYFLVSHGLQAGVLLAGGGIGFIFTHYTQWGVAIFLAGLMLCYQSVQKINARKRIDALEEKLRNVSHQFQESENEREITKKLVNEVLDTFLGLMAFKLGLTGNERINLFCISSENGYTLIGRYCEITGLSNMTPTSKTVFHPFLDKVCFNAEDICLLDDLPDIELGQGAYADCLRQTHKIEMEESALKKMRMKPRSLYLQVLTEDTRRVGVLVLESKRCAVFDKNRIDNKLMEHKPVLLKFIRHGKSYNRNSFP